MSTGGLAVDRTRILCYTVETQESPRAGETAGDTSAYVGGNCD